MSIKLGLHFICKDEAHCITKMLESCVNVADVIVANDTGSTDGTQDIIRDFGKKHNIPTFVVERPFDTFEKSRNYAMDTLRKVVKEDLKWDTKDVFGFWLDCDETLRCGKDFDKENITKDFYSISAYIGKMEYTRNTVFRLNKHFRWYGPVHEFIVCDDKDITSGILPSTFMNIDVKLEGNSWKGDIPSKYMGHAYILEKYVIENNTDPRWLFYLAQSYHDAACIPNNKTENDRRLKMSMHYYKERTHRFDGYPEEIYYSQYRVAELMDILEYPWMETLLEYQKAFSIDPMRGESIYKIIEHYVSLNDYNIAYMYSKFAVDTFHNKSPFPNKILFIDKPLYAWKFLRIYCICALNSGHKEDAIKRYKELMGILNINPDYFNPNEIEMIKDQEHFFK